MNLALLDNYILEAERHFEQNEIAEGKRVLEELLAIEPGHGIAHNHMGWVYLYHLVDYAKSEYHLRLALKFAPEYQAVYVHLSSLFVTTGRFEEAMNMLNHALTVNGINKVSIYREFGKLYELKEKYSLAIHYYKMAIKNCMDSHEIEAYRANIKRAKLKRRLFLIW